MAYAIFEDEERFTRILATEQETWEAAERAGLVEIDRNGHKVLHDHLEIRFCNGEPEESVDADADFRFS